MLKEVVGPDDIAEVVSRWTGIPVTRLCQADKERLMTLAQRYAHEHDRQAPISTSFYLVACDIPSVVSIFFRLRFWSPLAPS